MCQRDEEENQRFLKISEIKKKITAECIETDVMSAVTITLFRLFSENAGFFLLHMNTKTKDYLPFYTFIAFYLQITQDFIIDQFNEIIPKILQMANVYGQPESNIIESGNEKIGLDNRSFHCAIHQFNLGVKKIGLEFR